MEGALFKQGAVARSFKKRWMRLCGHFISYAVGAGEAPRGVIDLRGAVVCPRLLQYEGAKAIYRVDSVDLSDPSLLRSTR